MIAAESQVEFGVDELWVGCEYNKRLDRDASHRSEEYGRGGYALGADAADD